MTTTPQYDRIVSEMPAGLESDIMTVLAEAHRNAPGQNVKRETLIYLIFDKRVDPSRLSTCTEDRQIRDAIENLTLQGYRIISQSGKPGYRLAVDEKDAEEYIAEIESRISKLQSKVYALRTKRPRYAYQPVEKTAQLSLMV